MSQQEVYQFLKRNPKGWFTSKQIAERLDASVGSVTCNLKKLRKSSEVNFKMNPERKNQFIYKFKK
ncbi:hypothetical protein GF327_02095 [Candidatus Woesearchaeota archaeon]|nr:hypothetical protein [Candidatus Woesearchaeota archaeon]